MVDINGPRFSKDRSNVEKGRYLQNIYFVNLKELIIKYFGDGSIGVEIHYLHEEKMGIAGAWL